MIPMRTNVSCHIDENIHTPVPRCTKHTSLFPAGRAGSNPRCGINCFIFLFLRTLNTRARQRVQIHTRPQIIACFIYTKNKKIRCAFLA